MNEPPRYFRPVELAHALALVSKYRIRLLAGGTDFYPGLGERAVDEDVLDLSAIPGLSGIERVSGPGGEVLRIGAMVRWSQVLSSGECASPALAALRQCAREVGARQIQNRGTLVGNVCNASPAADGIPTLMALGARVEMTSFRGARVMDLEDFVLGPRATALGRDEMVTALLLPLSGHEGARSVFVKMGARRYLVISVAMLAAYWVPLPAGRVAACRIAVGACSPVARRLKPFEDWCLAGMDPATQAPAIAASLALLSPIDDVRADAGYRLQLVQSLLEKVQLDMRGA